MRLLVSFAMAAAPAASNQSLLLLLSPLLLFGVAIAACYNICS